MLPVEILFSLPYSSPVPFQCSPNYPIVTTCASVRHAYLDALYSCEPAETVLPLFARRLYTAVTKGAAALDTLAQLERLVLPIQLFDHKWRLVIHSLLEGDDTVDLRESLQEGEHEAVLAWLAKRRDGATVDTSEQMTVARQQDLNEAVQELESLDTKIMCLILLSCVILGGRAKEKKRKRKDTTLSKDPLLLLDYLTDRLQITSLMDSVSLSAIRSDKKDDGKAEPNQIWWNECVEPFFKSRLDPDIYEQQKSKFFPPAPLPEDETQAADEPVAAPKPRTLLSLDKSARRKERISQDQLLTSSPTLKTLTKNLDDKESATFRKPQPPAPRRGASSGPEKRSIQRGDSLGASNKSKGLFNRRQVVVGARKTSSSSNRKDRKDEAATFQRKRKSVSPKKRPPKAVADDDDVLIPDTPQKKGLGPTASDARSQPAPGQDWRAALSFSAFDSFPAPADEDEDLSLATPKSTRKWVVPDSL